MDIVGSLILFCCASVRTCITSLLDMAINFNWFIKITRSFGSGFQSQNIARPKVRSIIIEQKSEQIFLPDQIKEHFGLWTGDSFIDFCFFFYFNIMFIVHNVSGTICLIFPERRHYFLIFLLRFLCRERHLLMLYVAIMGHADPWIFSVSASYRLRTVSTPVRLVSLQCCAELRFVLLSEVI